MSKVTATKEFEEIAEKVKSTGVGVPMTKQQLRYHFGDLSKIGSRIKDDISRELRRLKVTTEPSFRGKRVTEFTLVKSVPRQQPAPVGAVDQEPPPIVPEMDENGGDLGELAIANQFPTYINKNATAEALFQRLVESGSRAMVLVVESNDPPKQGKPDKPILRKPVGVVTWESYAHFITKAAAEDPSAGLVHPTPTDAMNRDIAIAYGTDDLIHSLMRIEKKGILVIMDSHNQVTGIATKRDIHNELAEDLLPYRLIGLIEDLLRNRIEAAGFPADVFQKVSNRPDVDSVDKLDFSHYAAIFSIETHFNALKVRGAPKEMGQLLDSVRVLRNHLMHFNTEDDIDYTSELRNKYEALRKLLNDD